MSGYIGNIPTPQATQSRQSFTATAGQTTFATVGYTAGFIDVYLNGVHLLDGTDYTATNGSDIVLTTGAALDDVVEFVAYSTYEVNSQNYTGGLTVDNDGATVLTVDRATSDGTIIDVQKNGVSVGSIGASGGTLTVGNKTDHSGVNLGYRNLFPMIGGSSNDGAVSIGSSTSRFKDLYLSGGVYLGGTGAANKLDDYEEGTWTPVFASNFLEGCWAAATGFGTALGKYQKVGNVVNCWAEITITGTSGNLVGDDNFSFQGLPFTPDSFAIYDTLHGSFASYNAVGNGTNASGTFIPLASQSVVVAQITAKTQSTTPSGPLILQFSYITTS